MSKWQQVISWCVVCSMALCITAEAQLAIPGNTALENVTAAGARAPGNMTIAGIARAKNTFNSFRARNVISETEQPTPPHAVFYAEAIEIIFNQLNDLLFFLHNLSLIQAGEDPLPPPPDDSTDGTGDDTDGGRDGGRGGGRR